MSYDKEYAKKVYSGLIKRGYTTNMLGDEASFVERMGDEGNRRYLYDKVQQRGDANIGSWERFNGRFAVEPHDTSSYTFTSEQLGIDEQPTYSEEVKQRANERAEKGDFNFNPYGKGMKRNLIEAPEINVEKGWAPRFDVDGDVAKMEKAMNPTSTPFQQAKESAWSDTAQIAKRQAESAVEDYSKAIEERLNTAISAREKVYDENYGSKFGDIVESLAVGASPMRNSQFVSRKQAYIDSDDNIRTLRAAQNIVGQTEKMIEDFNSRSNWASELGTSMVKTVFNPETWDMGVSDVNTAERLLTAVNKADKGDKLTEDEQLLIDAAINNQVMQWYYGEITGGQLAGQAFGESLPFMAQIAMNPVSGIGKYAASKATKAVAKYAIKKLGKEGMGKVLTKVVKAMPKVTAVGSRALGNVAGGYGMAVTSNIANTTADALKRMTGEMQIDVDDYGNIRYDGRKNVKEAGEAFVDAINNQGAEFVSEQMGLYFKPITKGIGKILGTTLDKVTLGTATKMLNEIQKKGGIPALKQFFEKTQFDGFFEEYGEEIANGLMNAALVGDTSVGEVFSKDNLIDTAIGLSVMGAVGPTLTTVNFALTKRKEKKSLNEAYNNGRGLLRSSWNDFVNAVHNSKDGKELSANLRQVLNSYGRFALPLQDQRAILDYAVAYNRYKALEEVSAKAVSEGLADVRDLEQQKLFEEGSVAKNKHEIRTQFEEARNKVAGALNIGTDETQGILTTDDVAWSLADRYEDAGDNNAADAIREYVKARALHSGMINQMKNDADAQIESANNEIDAITNKDGMVYPVTLGGDLPGYVVGGQLITDENGEIDPYKTNEINEGGYVYVMENGRVRTLDARAIKSVGEVISAEEMKQQKAFEINTAMMDRYNAETAPTASTEVAPTESVPASSVEEEAARAVGAPVADIESIIPTREEADKLIAANISNGSTVEADAIKAYADMKFGPMEAVVPESAVQETVAPELTKEQQREEVIKRIPSKGNKRLWTKANPEDVKEYITLLTDDVTKQLAAVDRYIADVRERQEKADPIEALEMEEDVAFWNNVKGLLEPAPVESAQPATVETTEEVAPVAENEMQPVENVGAVVGDQAEGNLEMVESVEAIAKPEVAIVDPRNMSNEERTKRGEMLRDAVAVDVEEGVIKGSKDISARKAAEKWWDENVSEPAFYDTEVGEVEISRNSIESSLAHRYGQAKLDALTSLIEGFENAVYLGSMPDGTRHGNVVNHYFAYPINYAGKRCYVFCRAMHDANKNRLYVHEVFVADNIKKGDTLQTAASQPHGGIALYKDILANVLDVESTSSASEDRNIVSNAQENSVKSGEILENGGENVAPDQSGIVDNNNANALQNGNNELNLQKENEFDNEQNQDDIPVGGQVPQSVPQGEHGTQTSHVGGAQETAARLRERIESAQGDSKSGLREVENRVAREFAQENGLWIENEVKLGVPFPSGDEHNNYIDAESQVVYKVNNRMHTLSILGLLDRIEQHNKYFPDSKYS